MKLQDDSTTEAALAAQIGEVVRARVADRDIPLPSVPRVAMQAFALLRDQDYSVNEVAAVVESDPLVVTRLVRLANGPAFACPERVETVLACVVRLGRRELVRFLMETAIHRLIEGHDTRIAQLRDELWRHSLSVAILAHDLGAQVPPVDAQAAYLAGLLHDVGRPAVASMLLDAEHRLFGTHTDRWLDATKWLGVVLECERTVGLAIARRCRLPDAVVQAVGDCLHYDAEQPLSLANFVRLADTLATISGGDPAGAAIEPLLYRVQEGCELVGLSFHSAVAVTVNLPERLAARMP